MGFLSGLRKVLGKLTDVLNWGRNLGLWTKKHGPKTDGIFDKPHRPGPKAGPLSIVLLLLFPLISCNGFPFPIPIPIPTPAPSGPYDCDDPPDLAGLFIQVENAIENRVIVKLRPKTGPQPSTLFSVDEIQVIASKFSLQDVQRFQRLGAFSATIDDVKTVAKILSDPDVLFVSQEQLYSIDPRPADEARTWGIDRIDQRSLPLDDEYSPFGTGEEVHIDIIDTGITDHPDFGGRLIEPCHTEVVFRGCNDGHGHGTHVAGTAASTTWGVAKKAFLHSVRVLDTNGSGSTSMVIAGINKSAEWARAGGPRIANMSLGGSPDPPLDQAVCDAIDAGVVFAIAAGNDGQDPWSHSPARVLQALTVGASDSSDNGAAWSNKGEGIDVWAPGVAIRSTTPEGGTTVMQGTSMASPHVAGAAALWLEADPEATMAEVAESIIGDSTPDKLSGIGSESPNRLLFVGSE
jgi:subtilisin family serine protease